MFQFESYLFCFSTKPKKTKDKTRDKTKAVVKIIYKSLDNYCDNTTLHGLRYVGDPHLTIAER